MLNTNEFQSIIHNTINEFCESKMVTLYNKKLNPALWGLENKLDPTIQKTLLDVANDFYLKTKFTAPIIDIQLMGSIANYNWTETSDIDVHIIIDFNALGMPMETAEKTTKVLSTEWNKQHNITIKKHKVEINIQDVNIEKPYVMGVYSILNNKWIKQPIYIQHPNINKPLILNKYSKVKKYINAALLSNNLEEIKAAKEWLDDYRQYGLDNGGELSVENIVFKLLRNGGHIQKLKDSIVGVYDKEHTIVENDEFDPVQYGAKNVESANFEIKFVREKNPMVGTLYAKFLKGEENHFANVYRNLMGDGKWVINRHFGAFNLNLPDVRQSFETLEELLNYLEKWKSSANITENTHAAASLIHQVLKKYPKQHVLKQYDKYLATNIPTIDKNFPENSYAQHFADFLGKVASGEILLESDVELRQDAMYDSHSDFFERRDRQMCEIANFLKSNKKRNIPWRTISATLLKKTWLKFGKYNKVDDNDIDKVADQILHNIARLYVCNEFTGHSTNYHLREEIADNCGITFTDKEWDDNCWRFEDKNGSDYISDYGIEPLMKIYSIIFSAETPEAKLYACDKALNVVHQRNDLAAMFVEGGVSTLTQIANQGGYNAGYNYGDVNKEMRALKEVVNSNGTMEETTKKDIKARHPNNPMWFDKVKGWDLSKLTLDNLKALRDKSGRFYDVYKKKKFDVDPNVLNNTLAQYKRFDDEINKRLQYINKPINEVMKKNEMSEGYGAGKPEEDPLQNKNERWRIEWGTRKTPQLNENATSPNTYYHVTFGKYLKKIKKYGVKSREKGEWTGAMKQDIREKKGVFVFTNYYDAISWAFKTSWHFQTDDTFIITLKTADTDFVEDTHWESATGIGKWMVKETNFEPYEIVDIEKFNRNSMTPELAKKMRDAQSYGASDEVEELAEIVVNGLVDNI